MGLGKGAGEAEAYYENEQSGDATYYGVQNVGNCAIVPRPRFFFSFFFSLRPCLTTPPSWFSSLSFGVALNNVQYISGDESQGCGLCVRGTYSSGGSGADPPPASFTALVTDRCPEVKKRGGREGKGKGERENWD